MGHEVALLPALLCYAPTVASKQSLTDRLIIKMSDSSGANFLSLALIRLFTSASVFLYNRISP
jgi:hypothetical protein